MRRIALALLLCFAWPAFAAAQQTADPPRAKESAETGGKQSSHHFQGLNQGAKQTDKKQKDPTPKTDNQ